MLVMVLAFSFSKKLMLKKLAFCAALFLSGIAAYGQNPTLVYGTNGLDLYPSTTHAGKVTIGITTNGAVAGQILLFNGTTWTPANVSAAGGGDIFAASNNVFTANNTFRKNLIATNSVDGSVTNYMGMITLYGRKTDDLFLQFIATNGAAAGTVTGDGANGFQLGTPTVQMHFNEAISVLSVFGGTYQWDINGYNNTGNLSVGGTFNANGQSTLNTNVYVGGNFVSTNGISGAFTNYLGSVRIYNRATDSKFLNLMATNGQSVGNLTWDTSNGFTLATAGGNASIAFQETLAQVNIESGNHLFGSAYYTSSAGAVITHGGIVNLSSNLTINGNTTVGDGAARTVVMNANTMTIVGQLGINSFAYITNSTILIGASTPPASLVAKVYVNGSVRADNYMYNVLTVPYSASGTGTNSIDFSSNMVVNVTNVTAGLTLTSANLLAGRSVDVIFQGTTSNILLTVPTAWKPVSQTFAAVVTNKMVVLHALSLGTADSNVVYSITQQP